MNGFINPEDGESRETPENWSRLSLDDDLEQEVVDGVSHQVSTILTTSTKLPNYQYFKGFFSYTCPAPHNKYTFADVLVDQACRVLVSWGLHYADANDFELDRLAAGETVAHQKSLPDEWPQVLRDEFLKQYKVEQGSEDRYIAEVNLAELAELVVAE